MKNSRLEEGWRTGGQSVEACMQKTISYWAKIYDKAQMGVKMMEEILVVKDLHVSYSDVRAGFWGR